MSPSSQAGDFRGSHGRAQRRAGEGSGSVSPIMTMLTPGMERRTAGRVSLLNPEAVGAWMSERGALIGPQTEGDWKGKGTKLRPLRGSRRMNWRGVSGSLECSSQGSVTSWSPSRKTELCWAPARGFTDTHSYPHTHRFRLVCKWCQQVTQTAPTRFARAPGAFHHT